MMLMLILNLVLSPGNPFFLHPRIGKNGRRFRLIKFRTMKASKDSSLNLTIAGDNRVTRFGSFLRQYKLDELPQLFNILQGAMSFVGPRPETPEYVAKFTTGEREILDYKPGLTDPSSLKYRYEEEMLAKYKDPVEGYLTEILPDKIALSLAYQKRRSFWSDCGVLWQTVVAIFK
jgi:lipopolysaccharide/colanic/teichoic acid biosynthesis glycosyltransferase